MPEITRNGVGLHYEEAGSGGPPLLFVHGFGGSTSHFAPQLEHFRRRHRVVALDRRGYGRSDKPEGPYTIPAIAEEVAWTARELGLHKPVLVVHSMGVIGLDLVSQHPELASALVVLDAPLFPPSPVRGMFEELLAGLRTPAYREVIEGVCSRLIFLPTDDEERRRQLHAGIIETPQSILVSTWEHFLAYDPAPAALRCKLPLLYVNAVMPFDEGRLRELCPRIQIGRTVGAGHLHQVEVPEQVNAMIEQFLRVSLPENGA
jgi:pimeloyl-ACP methyl ester carboxylesterase